MRKRTLILPGWRAGLLAALASLVLAGCGGGGGGGTDATPTPPPTSVQILDSFGQVVVAGGADGVGPGDSGGDGTAGDGSAIVGGVVVLTDTTGKSVSATTDAQGYYRAKLTGFTPPLVAKVTKTDGKVLHSLSVKTLKVNGFITVNITGLTDKVASDVARAGGKNGAADLTPQIVSSNVAAIDLSVKGLRSAISTALTAAGVDANSFDPLAAPFRPDHTGYDFILDHVVVVVAADGSTQVSVAPSLVPAVDKYVGTWASCDARDTGSKRIEVTVTKTGVTSATVALTESSFAAPGCTGTATDISTTIDDFVFSGTKTIGTDTVDKIVPSASSGQPKQVLLVKGSGPILLFHGREAGNGGTLDAEGYPETLWPEAQTKQVSVSTVDKYVGTWIGCNAGVTASKTVESTFTKTGDTSGNLSLKVTSFAVLGCVGTAMGTSITTGSVVMSGTKTIGTDIVDKMIFTNASNAQEKLVMLVKGSGPTLLFSGRLAADGGTLDAEGYPETLEADILIKQ